MTTVDYYARSGRRWAEGAALVYAPVAAALVARSPHSLAGRTVLDAGAGTGAASDALLAVGAQPIASDLSPVMLGWNAAARPAGFVADIRALPLCDDAVDDAVAAFVLNHLDDPGEGLAELVRVSRPGGAVLATVFSNSSRSEVRDRIDEVARQAGWVVPAWYADIKATAVPLLGTAAAMATALRAAGLVDVRVEERAVDVGVTTAEDLVTYRFGQAQFAAWLDALGEDRAAVVARLAADTVHPVMQPYRPLVIFGAGLLPSQGLHIVGQARP